MGEFTACLVLPAGGSGIRLGSDPPKQFCLVAGHPLIYYTIKSFSSIPWISHIVVVVEPARIECMQEIISTYNFTNISIAEGGSARHRSIFNGVKHIPSAMSELPDLVILHDAVRPFITEDNCKTVAESALQNGAAGTTRPLVSTVISATGEDQLGEALDRAKYKNSEMPQAFRYEVIKAAYEKSTDSDLDYGTECLQLAQKYAGAKVGLVDGPEDLWKVTYRKDLYAVDGIMKEKENQVVVVGCNNDARKDLLSGELNLKFLKVDFVESLKTDITKAANHVVIFLNDDAVSNGTGGEEESDTDVFPDISKFHDLRTLTYMLWNVPDKPKDADAGEFGGESEYDDFRSLIKAHHLLGKGHSICTFGMFVDESLLVEEKMFQSNVFSLLGDVLFNRNKSLSGQVFEV